MGRKKTYEKDDVLEKAMDLFWKKGFEGSHLDEILQVTGMNRFSLYKEFGGKQQLFEAVLSRYISEVQVLGQALDRSPLGVSNILDYLYGVAEARFVHGCLILNTMTERHVIRDETFSSVEKFMAEAEKKIFRNLKAGQKAGEISKSADLHGLAKTIMALDTGIIMYNILGISVRDKRKIVDSIKPILQ